MKANEVTARLFCKAADHLIAQGKRSYDADRDLCLYRGPSRAKCAIGALISDAHYHNSFEGGDVDWSSVGARRTSSIRRAVRESQNLEIGDRVQWRIMYAVQSLHDQVSPYSWSRRLSALADTHGIDWKPKQ